MVPIIVSLISLGFSIYVFFIQRRNESKLYRKNSLISLYSILNTKTVEFDYRGYEIAKNKVLLFSKKSELLSKNFETTPVKSLEREKSLEKWLNYLKEEIKNDKL